MMIRVTHRFRHIRRLVIVSIVASGCSGQSPEAPEIPVAKFEPKSVVEQPSQTSTEPSARRSFDNLTFRVPVGWEEVALSQMQRGILSGKFELPEHGTSLLVTLSSVGGGIDANINRWRGQFTGATEDIDERSIRGRSVRWVELAGHFNPGFGKSAIAEARMIGVAIPDSKSDFYIKLTGSAEEVARAEDEFQQFVESLRTKS